MNTHQELASIAEQQADVCRRLRVIREAVPDRDWQRKHEMVYTLAMAQQTEAQIRTVADSRSNP